MNKTPLITVIIPFFNSEKFLRETIESVLKQTYPYLELLLIDDELTDSSTGIAVEYARTYPGIIRYFEHANHENLGANASRNLGIRNSRGEYIAMLDSDDIFLPDKLEIQLKAIKEKPDLVLLGCRAGEIDTEGNFRGTNTPTRGVNKIRWNILLSNQFTHSSIIMRKNIIVQNIELYNESFPVAQEWEFT